MKFTKMQGIGNDYVYVNCFKEKVEDPGEAAIKVSDRHFGIGSDGLILIKPSEVADFQMDMYNADGSRGAMCGNGIRCVAKYVYDYGLTDKTSVSVETASGIKYLDLTVENGKVALVKVNMGAPILEAAKIPVVSEKEQVINEPLLVDGKEYRITGVSMGNPHAITYIDDVKGLDIEKIGPKFEFHPAFPDRVNTEFAKVLDDHTVEMRVWERGSGETLACVSYPGYDNNRLTNNMDTDYYAKLSTDLSSPFFNKATQQKTAPGSTLKILSTVAGMSEGVIDDGTYIECTGSFDLVTPPINCWNKQGHGSLDIREAIEQSCNVFFTTIGFELGKDSEGNFSEARSLGMLQKYASLMGLDQKTGIEISEASPQVSDKNAVPSYIGQGTNAFTTSQLARYASTIATSGTIYKLSLLDRVTDSKGKLIKEYPSETAGQLDLSSNIWDDIHDGMYRVVQTHDQFNGLGVEAAGKTGTAEIDYYHPNNALFIGYAPVSDPKYAISVRIANGYASGNACLAANDIFKYIFGLADESTILTGYAASDTSNVSND